MAKIKCPECGGTSIETRQEEESFVYSGDIIAVTVPVHRCDECDFTFTDAEADAIKDKAIAEYLAVKAKSKPMTKARIAKQAKER